MSGDEPTQTGTTYIGQPTNPTNTLEWYSTNTTNTTNTLEWYSTISCNIKPTSDQNPEILSLSSLCCSPTVTGED